MKNRLLALTLEKNIYESYCLFLRQFYLFCFRVFVVTLLFIWSCTGQTLISQTCSTVRSSVDIEMTGANAVIGGLFEMRTAILGGYACGEPHKGTSYIMYYFHQIAQNKLYYKYA